MKHCIKYYDYLLHFMNQLILYNYRANTWCFTVQNYDEEIYEIFQKLNLKNMVYGKEEAQEQSIYKDTSVGF